VGLLLFEVRRAALAVAEVLRQPPVVPMPSTEPDTLDSPARPEPTQVLQPELRQEVEPTPVSQPEFEGQGQPVLVPIPEPEPERLAEQAGEPVAASPQPEMPAQVQYAQEADELWYGDSEVETLAAPADRPQPPVTVVASTAAEDPGAPVAPAQRTAPETARRAERRDWGSNGPAPRTGPTAWR
jgi:hypothetical protein